AHLERTAALVGNGDEITARRPNRGRIGAITTGDPALVSTIGIHHIDLRTAATVGREHDLGSIRRVGGRGVDRIGVCETRGRTGAHIHRINIGVTVLTQEAHDHFVTVGREARSKGHAREIADEFALASLKLQEIDLGLATLIGHVSDFLAFRRKARGQNDRTAIGQEFMIGAILVHDSQTLHALICGAGFVNVDDARIEVAAFTGELLIDRVRDNMRDAAPVLVIGKELLTDELLASKGVPETKFCAQASVRLSRYATGYDTLCIDDLPVFKAGCRVWIRDLLDKSSLVDRREEAGTA